MRRLLCWAATMIVIVAFLLASAGRLPAELPCTSLETCIGSLQMLAKASPRSQQIRGQAEVLLARISAFAGADAALVPLLEDTDIEVAKLAGRALRDTPHIDPAYLPEIKRGLDRGLGWLAPALARMDTDEAAAEAVRRYLRSDSAPHNQEGYAVELSGARAVPYIVEAARCETTCDDRRHYLLGEALHSMPPSVRSAVASQLISIAMPADVSDQVGRGVVGMISELGAPAMGVEADLLRLRSEKPTWSWTIDHALIGIGSSEAGRIFTQRLMDPSGVTLRDVAQAGPAAAGAAGRVIALLDDADPELRIAAARTLGFLGDAAAVPALADKLDDPADPRMAWVAAESLGRLRVGTALQALQRASVLHWYPPVRQAATLAIVRMSNGEPYVSKFHPDNFPFEFFRYLQIGRDEGVPVCNVPVDVERAESTGTKLRASTHASDLEALSYSRTEVEIAAPLAGSAGVREVVERRQLVKEIPSTALRVPGGWILGSDRGEWGGELVFLSEGGVQHELLQENVEDIFRFGNGYVAVVGLAHLGGNHGALITIEQAAGGWKASTWRILPGAPRESYLTADGDLLVVTHNGGTIVVSIDGRMRMAECRKPAPDDLSARAQALAREEAKAAAAEAAEAAMDALDDWP